MRPILVSGGSFHAPMQLALPQDGNVFVLKQADPPVPPAAITLSTEGFTEGALIQIVFRPDYAGRYPRLVSNGRILPFWTPTTDDVILHFCCAPPGWALVDAVVWQHSLRTEI